MANYYQSYFPMCICIYMFSPWNVIHIFLLKQIYCFLLWVCVWSLHMCWCLQRPEVLESLELASPCKVLGMGVEKWSRVFCKNHFLTSEASLQPCLSLWLVGLFTCYQLQEFFICSVRGLNTLSEVWFIKVLFCRLIFHMNYSWFCKSIYLVCITRRL